MKTEFIILVPEADTFCNTEKAFIDLLNVDALISVTRHRISYKSAAGKEIVDAKFHLDMGAVKAKKERYFLVRVDCDDENSVEDFSAMCDRVKLVASRLAPGQTAVNTMWDDVGAHYAKKAYPIIHNVENLMRKLIETFMLLNVGMGWSKDSMNPELLRKIEADGEGERDVNDMHKLDFIQLNDFLFGQKRDLDIHDVDKLLRKKTFAPEDHAALQRYLPQSNWEKHFSQVIEEKDSSLKEKWSRLYKLRNKVAHNRSVSKAEFDEIMGLSAKIEKIATQAILKLDEIHLDQQERESIIQAFETDPTAQKAYECEVAVVDYYAGLGFSIEQDDNNQLDFYAQKAEQLIGVEVKTTSFRPARLQNHQRLRSDLMRWQRQASLDGLTSMHLVYVLLDSSQPRLNTIIELTKQICATSGPVPVEVYFGLMKGGHYIPIPDRWDDFPNIS